MTKKIISFVSTKSVFLLVFILAGGFFLFLNALNASSVTDPYENVRNDDTLKGNLLRRMSNVSIGGDAAFGCCPNQNVGGVQGRYLQTPDPNELRNLFLEVSKSIRMRLVE